MIMAAIKFIKFDSMTYVAHFKNGQLKKEGRGLSFFYYSPRSSITAVPLGSRDLQFIFTQTTKDFQTVTVQGQITYMAENPKQLAELLDFTVDAKKRYKEDNFEKLELRLNNEAQTSTSVYVQGLLLKESIRSAKTFEEKIEEGLRNSDAIKSLGLKVLSVDVLAVQPTPEMRKALETETVELLQKEADRAIYERRNFAVEQERKIKESEYNTEIAVEEKKKIIQQKKAEIEKEKQENRIKLRIMDTKGSIEAEELRKQLVAVQAQNKKAEADAKAYEIEKLLEPFRTMEWKILASMPGQNTDAKNNIALAFRELAENASKIQNLNITPDLLSALLNDKDTQTLFPPEAEAQQYQ
jgi:hypothetical protein